MRWLLNYFGITMRKRVVILIDGQNLYYSLKNLSVLEREIHWGKFFQDLIEDGDELIRSYWFRPEKIHDSYYTWENITHNVIRKYYGSYIENYKTKKILPDEHKQNIEKKVRSIKDWIEKEKATFLKIEYTYDQISLNFEDIEIVKTGIVKINPYKQIYLSEKGVDIALAVKMISLSVDQKADKIILVSGDFDYSEAIKFVKNNMTKVHIVKFHKGYPPRNKNMSRDLSVLADKVIDIYESDINMKYRLQSAA